MSQKKDFKSGRKTITYLDLFAGAEGFSEGFMQDIQGLFLNVNQLKALLELQAQKSRVEDVAA